MKEVVEYILAGLIIVSIIPVYDYIMTNLYSPPELEVEQSVVMAFTDQVAGFLDEAALYGNLSSPIVDLKSLIKEKFPYFAQEYDFHIELISMGIEKVVLDDTNIIEVYTRDKGNVTVLIIYNDLTIENKTEEQPSVILSNGTYIYKIKPSYLNKEIIFITAVLDTGLYRFIDYYETDKIQKAYVGNYNGALSIITSSPLNYYSLPDNIEGVHLQLVSYSKSKFEELSESVSYGEITGLDFSIIYEEREICILPWWCFIIRVPVGIAYNVYYNSTKLKYYAIYEDNISFRGTNYYVHLGSLLTTEGIEVYPYEFFFNFTTNIGNPTYTPTEASYIPIMAPIYNLPLAIVKDASGNSYIAAWYPHKIEIGYGIPTTIPTTTVRMIKRLGMVDYLIVVTMWRRTI